MISQGLLTRISLFSKNDFKNNSNNFAGYRIIMGKQNSI